MTTASRPSREIDADEATTRAFGDITAVPTLFLFDGRGRTAGVTYGAPPGMHDQVGKAIEALLKQGS